MKSAVLIAFLVVAVCAVLSTGTPLPSDDLETAASHHGHHGRVHIKVYRGADHGHGKDGHAPFGYWVKQPADDDRHHY